MNRMPGITPEKIKINKCILDLEKAYNVNCMAKDAVARIKRLDKAILTLSKFKGTGVLKKLIMSNNSKVTILFQLDTFSSMKF